MPHALALRDDDDHDLDAIPVRADANGLAFDRRTHALYVADSYRGAIVRLDGDRQRRLATIEAGDVLGTERLGALALTPYGTLFATRPGYGQAGGVFRIEADGQVEALDKLSPRVARLGITYDATEHALYTTQFLTSRRGAYDGSVVMVDLVTGEPSTVIDGFGKPLGIVKLGPTLVVADARQRAVFRIDLVAGRAVRRLQLTAELARPHSMCSCGPDSVLITSFDDAAQRGAVCRLWLDGRIQMIARGAWEPRGVATDGERAFVAARRAGKVLVFRL